jgi:AAA family ATP:ADP antiporter
VTKATNLSPRAVFKCSVDISRTTGIEGRERSRVAWSFGLFFCVFASWYVLRPLRDAMGILGDAKNLPRLFLVTLCVTFAVTPVVSALASRVPRRRLLSIVYRALAATLVVFFVLLHGSTPNLLAARAFFVWASVLNLLAIALAWAFMADVFSRADGVRCFAVIGGGGTLGAMIGSLATTLLVDRVSPSALLLLAAALLECAVASVRRIAESHWRAPGEDAAFADGGVVRWIRRAFMSPFFLAVCAYLIFFTFTSSLLYLEQARIVRAAVPDTAARAALFAHMDLTVNALTLVLQLFVVGRALRAVGIATALAVLPVVTFGCFTALRIAPVLGVLVVCQVARRTLDFAVTKPAREVLFTVVRPEDKYKAKSFIDTFVYRSGDALAAIGFEGAWGPAVLGAMAVVCALWALLGVALGRSRGSHAPAEPFPGIGV